MRRVISFLFASVILCGGLYMAYLQFFQSDRASGSMLLGAGMAIVIGGGWLISDFVLPALRQKGND